MTLDEKTNGQPRTELRELRARVAELEEREAALRASEAMYRALVDAMEDAVHIKDLSGRYLLVNAALSRRAGLSRQEMLGKTVVDVYGPEVGAKLMEEDEEVARSGIPSDDVHEHKLPGGGVRWDHSRKVPFRNARGDVVGIVSVSRDITAHKLAEQAVQRERDLTSAVIDTIGNLLIMLDRHANVVRVNRAFERVTGYSAAEVMGQPIWKILAISESAQGKQAFEATLAGQFPNSAENYLMTRDGEKRLIAWTNTALLDPSGRPEYVLSVGTDVTEQRQAERALKEANERLTRSVEDLEEQGRETMLLSEMGDLLQTCLSFEEAYAVVARSAKKIFPSTAGGLFIISPSRNLVDAVATWGDFPTSERVFTPDQCWALRRGRTHVVENLGTDLVCRHVEEPLPASYLCVPMAAQGETIGSLHLRIDYQNGDAIAAKKQLATAVADHIALALANLRLQQTLRDQAVHDLLTGLFNRRYMDEMLERELLRAARRSTPVGVIMMDIDHFKQFNDLFGHEGGDALLSALGSYLRGSIRGEDIACRYGGEEILLILPDASLEDTLQRAEELREGIKALRVEHRRQPLGPVTVSAGVAAFPVCGKSKEDIIHLADIALYRAKVEGRDRVARAR